MNLRKKKKKSELPKQKKERKNSKKRRKRRLVYIGIRGKRRRNAVEEKKQWGEVGWLPIK